MERSRLHWIDARRDDLAIEIAAIARTDDMTISEVIHAAIADYIAFRPIDPDFQKPLAKS